MKIHISRLSRKLIVAIGAILIVFMTGDMLLTIHNTRDTALKEVERWSILLAETVRVSMNTLMKEEKMDARFDMFDAIRKEIKGLEKVRVIRGERVNELFQQNYEKRDIPSEQAAIASFRNELDKLNIKLGSSIDPLVKKDIESEIENAKSEIDASEKLIAKMRNIKSDPREIPVSEMDKQVLSTGKPIYQAEGDTLRVWAPYLAQKSCGETSGCHAGVKEGEVLGAVHMQFSLAQINKDMLRDAIIAALDKMLLGVLIIGCLVLMIHWVVIKNINTIHAALLRFRSGDLSGRISISGKDEVQDLAQGINAFIDRFVEMLSEVTREKQSAQENEERLRIVIDNANEGIITLSQTGEVESFNRAADHIFGYKAENIIGLQARLLIPDYETGAVGRMESVGRHQDGHPVPLEIAISEAHMRGVPQYVCIVHDITERKNAEMRLNQLANFDGLTGLPNRNLFRDRLATAITRADRRHTLVALMFLDLDRFKTINDTLGHGAGDQLLQHVATILSGVVRKGDTVARGKNINNDTHDDSTVSRLGGDEFTVILEGITKPEYVGIVAQKILEAFAKHPIILGGKEIYASSSIGVATYPEDASDAETLIKNADSAMYRSKEAGRGNFHFYTPELNAKVTNRFQLETDLRLAFDRDEFILHYQPKVDLVSREIIGAEALIRWQRGDKGVVAPNDFIPCLEETGLIIHVGEWVLRTACAQALQWQKSCGKRLQIAVNLSGRQLVQKDLVQNVATILIQTGLDPTLLELELTESMLMARTEHNIATMKELMELGVQISIDDFGTGYSSLSYLRRFSIHTLKIDRSFVQNIASEPDDAAIASAIIAMGKGLRLKVIAEGVETQEQLDMVHSLGCDHAQGYFLGRPMPPEEFVELVKKGRV